MGKRTAVFLQREGGKNKRMKVLIIGGSSLLGKYLAKTRPDDCDLFLTWYRNIPEVSTATTIWHRLDVRIREDVFELFELVKPDVVIHCAAIGSVDYAKDHYQEVSAVNVSGVKYVALAANYYGAVMVYISSNAVFSGKEPPYNENSALNPVNDYGIIKMLAERTVKDIAKKWIIIRPFLLYGWPYPGGRTNWAKSIIEKLGQSEESYKLVDDHIWMPTHAGGVAEAIWRLLYQDEGIYNVASPERATLYEFGLKVCEVFSLEKNLIQPIESDYFPSLAKRPHDTSYDLVRLSEAGIMLSDIKTGLEKMRDEA